MKYLIHTVGNVVLPQEKSYLVNASTEKKAQELKNSLWLNMTAMGKFISVKQEVLI